MAWKDLKIHKCEGRSVVTPSRKNKYKITYFTVYLKKKPRKIKRSKTGYFDLHNKLDEIIF